MNLSNPPPPVDLKDPRIRVTLADVAMRVASDGPMYGVIILVGILALRGTIEPLATILGAAFALQARSHPPQPFDKLGRLGPATMAIVLVLGFHVVTAVYRATRDLPSFSTVAAAVE